MSVFTKVVKNLAIAFGIFLAITIINFSLELAYILLDSTNLVNNDRSEIDEVNFIRPFSSLDIDLKVSNLTIKKGNNFRYETNIKDLKVDHKKETLIIRDKRKNIFKKNKDDVTIYVPDTMKFEKVAINIGAGKLMVEDVDLSNIDLDLGIGKATIESKITGKNTIECGVGKVILNLGLSSDDYTFKMEKGIGNITLNGKKVSDDSTIGNGLNTLNVDSGIGKIEIMTNDNR